MENKISAKEKYDNMIKESTEKLILNHFELNTVCDKTLNEVIHSREKYKIETTENYEEVLNINMDKKTNDIFEFFYTKNYTICPILYDVILNMSSPDDIGGLNLPYSNQKTLIFDYTNLFDKETFEKEYLCPFFKDVILPQLEEAYEEIISKSDEYQENYITYVN
jgi:hypothetical protein